MPSFKSQVFNSYHTHLLTQHSCTSCNAKSAWLRPEEAALADGNVIRRAVGVQLLMPLLNELALDACDKLFRLTGWTAGTRCLVDIWVCLL